MTTKNIDDLAAATTLAGTDKNMIAQGDAVLKRTTLTAIRNWIAGTLAAVATSGAKADVGLGNVANTLHNLSASGAPSAGDDVNAGYSVGSLWLWPAASRLWRAVGVSAGAAVWIEVSNYYETPYVAGNYYLPHGARAGGQAQGCLNLIRLAPVMIRHAVTISELFVRVVATQASQNFQLAIYAAHPATQLPTGNALGATGNASTASTATVAVALAANVAIVRPGLHWLAVNCDHGTPTFLSDLGSNHVLGGLLGDATVGNVIQGAASLLGSLTLNATYGSWPDLTSASFSRVSTCPVIGFKPHSVP
jgi:hypothetical protein